MRDKCRCGKFLPKGKKVAFEFCSKACKVKARKARLYQYVYEVTDTWQVTIDARTEPQARAMLNADGMNGYDKADYCHGVQVEFIERKD